MNTQRIRAQVAEKASFKQKGWSYRSAAPQLGVTYKYLCEVLNGKISSRRLLKKIQALPRRETALTE